MDGFHFGEGIENVGFTKAFAEACVLIKHLEEHKVTTLRRRSTHERSCTESFEFGEVRSRGPPDMLLCSFRETFFGPATKGVNDLRRNRKGEKVGG